MWRVIVVAVVAGALITALLFTVPLEYARLATTTPRRLLRATAFVRIGRRYRSAALRFLAVLAAWPHIVEVAVRLHRAGIEPPSAQEILRSGALRVLYY